ncbi:P-loop containing nucleoside triphosphate hydrolase protein [Gorgonomyces haynaldii]|nr:P-loop containing nucleoside triphosphate hydrolase protein [Gorgonomyces haynaldii]
METFRPVEPVTVVAKDLSVSIKLPSNIFKSETKSLPVLHHISIDASPGQVIAIMGGSGSGKTTLLHCLAGRTVDSSVQGQLLFNDKDTKPFYDNGSVGYVQQHDYLMPYLTVRETLRYNARLKLNGLSAIEQNQLVEEVIMELGLKECADTIIGDDWRKGISGGEKRRVSVGCQMLLNPSILFMDEPTTGLDSFASYNLLETLVNLSRRGRTIFISIHQPRSDIFSLFDSVILLSKGKTLYCGAGSTTCLSYFESIGFPCPENSNPADYLIDISSVDYRNEQSETETLAQINRMGDLWKKANQSDYRFKSSITQTQIELPKPEEDKEQRDAQDIITLQPKTTLAVKPHHKSTDLRECKESSIFSQALILTERAWKNLLRDNLALWGSLFECVVIGTVFGLIFFRLPEDQAGVLSRRAALYIVCSIQTYLMLIFVIYKTCNDIKVFDRERADKMYGSFAYIFSQLVAQFPFFVLFPTIYSLIVYFTMGFRTDDLAIHVIRFCLSNVLGQFVVFGYSLFCVSIARDFATASLVGNSLYTFFSFSTGFFMQLESIPIYIRWISKISFLTYQYRAIASNEFSDNSYACEELGRRCQGNDILSALAIGVNDNTIPYIALAVIFAVFLLIAFVLLKFYLPVTHQHAKPISSVVPVQEKIEQEVPEEPTDRRVDVKLDSIQLDLITKPYGGLLGHKPVKKTLLENISFHVPHSTLTMIMGGSGTGKSTLLSVLCARGLSLGVNTKMQLDGKLYFNGVHEKDPARIAAICSFVPQSDSHLLPALTCRETLYFAAELRLPKSMSRKAKVQRADHVARILGLSHCANTIVGNENVKGLSGGEKRRLSIGIQMLTDPSILIIDEPTSGLDAFTAHHIMKTLKELADSGRTILCSIHQPRTDIFNMFDNILLLTRGGRVGYSGPAKSIIPHFDSLGYKLPALTNPADFILDMASVDFRSQDAETESKKRVDHIVSSWKARDSTDLENPFTETTTSLRELTPFLTAFPALLHRSIINTRRQPLIVIARILQVTFLGVIICLYYAPQSNGQVGVQNRLGVLQQSISVLFVGMLNCVAVFPNERDTLFHEYADRAYNVGPFLLAYNMIEIPVEIISALLFTLFTMVIVQLRTTVSTFFCMVFAIFCLVNVGESIGIIFCSIVRHVGFSVSLTNAVLGIFNVLTGFLSSKLPVFLDRINRISPIPYFSRMLAINEFDKSVTFTCTPEEIQSYSCIYKTGPDVLRLLTSSTDVFGFDYDSFGFYIGVGAGLTVAYRIIAFFVLKFNAK